MKKLTIDRWLGKKPIDFIEIVQIMLTDKNLSFWERSYSEAHVCTENLCFGFLNDIYFNE